MDMLTAAVSGLVVLCLGVAAGFFIGRLRQSRTDARLEQVEKEFSAYREQVAAHFSKTADQFHAIGVQYRELYEHLAAGSAALGVLEPPAGDGLFPSAIADADVPGGSDRVDDMPASLPDAATEVASQPESSPETSAAPADPKAEAKEAPDADPEAAEPAPDNVVELVPRSDAESDDETDPDERTYH